MSYGYNVYYNPEEFGLSVIAEIEYSDHCYQFDTRVVWKHGESGRFYTARASGCSCPTPFEDYRSLEDLEELRPYGPYSRSPINTDDLRREAGYELVSEDANVTPEQVRAFLNKIRNAH